MKDYSELLDRLENWWWPLFGWSDAAVAIRELEAQVKEYDKALKPFADNLVGNARKDRERIKAMGDT